MQARFKTLKSVRCLVYGRLSLYRQFRQVAGWGHLRLKLNEIFHLETRMYSIGHELVEWSRLHRRLNNGRPAVIDDFLLEHAGDIRAALTALTTAVDELAALEALSAAQESIIADYRLDLHAAWRLDLAEPEEHEIARLAPKPAKVDPTTDETFRNLNPEQRTRVLDEVRAVVLELAGRQPVATDARCWVPDVMLTSPMQRVAGGWS